MQIDEKALRALAAIYEWYDRDGSVGGASAVFEEHRAAYESAKQKGEAEGWVLVPRDLVERAQHALSASEFGDDRCVAAEISAMLSAGGEG